VKAPCTNLNAESCFPIYAGSELARLIRDTNICVWHEVSMAHKHLMTGLDRLFKDLMQDDRPFGGKLVFMNGDFRHNLPIIPGGSEAQITNACLKRSPLWNTVAKLVLTENTRGRNREE
jgi:ATP-dependent DNA helicase PIF1